MVLDSLHNRSISLRLNFLTSQLEILIAPMLVVVMRVKYDILVNAYYTVAHSKYLINDDYDNGGGGGGSPI